MCILVTTVLIPSLKCKLAMRTDKLICRRDETYPVKTYECSRRRNRTSESSQPSYVICKCIFKSIA